MHNLLTDTEVDLIEGISYLRDLHDVYDSRQRKSSTD